MNLEYRHFRWIQFIWDADLTTKAKVVAAFLADCMNANADVAWPSLKTLAKKTGQSHQTVINALNELEQAGWITKELGGLNKGSNRYYTHFPKSVEQSLMGHAGGAGDALALVNHVDKVVNHVDKVVNHVDTNNPKNNPKNREGRRFAPPTLLEVTQYVREKNLAIDPGQFFAYFEAGNWHDSRGNPVKNWKQKALTWHGKNGRAPSPASPSYTKAGDYYL